MNYNKNILKYFNILMINGKYSSLKLTELPDLPPTLETLYCSENALTELPNLPPTLKTLSCDNNALTTLPDLPLNLEALSCCNNALTTLPNLPPTLKTLICDNTALTVLPDLPLNLNRLFCRNNPITQIGRLSNNSNFQIYINIDRLNLVSITGLINHFKSNLLQKNNNIDLYTELQAKQFWMKRFKPRTPNGGGYKSRRKQRTKGKRNKNNKSKHRLKQ